VRIIKPGRINKRTKLFTCDNCGCVFKADYGEYTLSDYFGKHMIISPRFAVVHTAA